MDQYINNLESILMKKNVCISHGIGHAITVMNNAKNALISEKYNLNDLDYKSILLAALLHDADDRKFFPDNKNYENLREILKNESEHLVTQVITMVDLVSSSKNGDNIPNYVVEKMWMLIPRYSDRLEAIGLVGIERVYQYAKTVNNPLYIESTPKPTTEDEIWEIASENRYKSYSGSSLSMIDHFYDKLLRASFFPIKNTFLNIESKIRRKPMIDFLLFFGNKENLSDIEVINFIKDYYKYLIKLS
jgi:uncharacterized protein